MSKASVLLRNLGLIGIGRVSIQAVSILLLPVLTGTLNPAEYGTVDLIVTYVALCAPLISLQLETAVFRFLIAVRGDEGETKATISTATLPIVVLLSLSVAGGLIAGFLFEYPLIWYFTVNLATMILFNLLAQTARGIGRNALYAAGNITIAATTLSAVLLAAWFKVFDVQSYLLILAGANAVSFVVIFIALRFHTLCDFRLFAFDRLKKLLKYSFPMIPNSLSWWIISASGRTVAAIFLSVYYVGILAAATKFSAIVTGLSTVFSLAWMEAASVSINDSDRPAFFSKVVNHALSFFSALTIFTIGVVPIMLSILVDDSFAEAYYYVPILLIGALGHSMVSFYSGVLIAQNKTSKVANTSIVSAALSLAVSLIFVHSFGLYAIAVSTAVAYFFMVIYRQVLMQRELRIKYRVSTLSVVFLSLLLVVVLYYLRIAPIMLLVVSAVASFIVVGPASLEALRTFAARRKSRGHGDQAITDARG